MIFELNSRIFNIMIRKGSCLYMINLFACTLNEFDFVKSARSFLNFFFFVKSLAAVKSLPRNKSRILLGFDG